jgi:hypothetical protein
MTILIIKLIVLAYVGHKMDIICSIMVQNVKNSLKL